MTAYLKPGDRIMLAVPDFFHRNSAAEDRAGWQAVYDAFGVTVEHVAVHRQLTHPVVVAVLRDDNTEEDKTCAFQDEMERLAEEKDAEEALG